MPAWTAFASVAGVVTVLLLLLSHATSKQFVTPGDDGIDVGDAGSPLAEESVAEPRTSVPRGQTLESESGAGSGSAVGSESGAGSGSAVEWTRSGDEAGATSEASETSATVSGAGPSPPAEQEQAVRGTVVDHEAEAGSMQGTASDGEIPMADPTASDRVAAREFEGVRSLSAWMVFLNVALSQGLFAVVLVVAVIAADVPWGALGVAPAAVGWEFAVLGVGFGIVLYAADEIGASVAERFGVAHTKGLRELLAPESPMGWVVLLVGVLPVVAGFEEFLFRGILIGAFSTGFGVSPWLLVVASSVAFGLGHGAQGRLGVFVTAALGVVLGTAFVLTESLLVVIAAHYVVNALEFVVHEALGVDWTE